MTPETNETRLTIRETVFVSIVADPGPDGVFQITAKTAEIATASGYKKDKIAVEIRNSSGLCIPMEAKARKEMKLTGKGWYIVLSEPVMYGANNFRALDYRKSAKTNDTSSQLPKNLPKRYN